MIPDDEQKPGPDPDELKVEGDWEEAMKKALGKERPPEGWPKMHEYTDGEAAAIRDALRRGDTSPPCPRDGAQLAYTVSGVKVRKDEPARGVRLGDYEDAWSADVECVTCHAIAEIDLTERIG